jgi:hypothetical protein
MKNRIRLLICILLLVAGKFSAAQNPLYSDTTITIINGDTILGKPIEFKKYDQRFVDFMFFDGSYNIVAFRLTENNECFQLMLSSLDSSTWCFTITEEEFAELMAMVEEMNRELEQQTNWPVKCNYCQTMQFFWYEGDVERSALKRSVAIPISFNSILDFCYDVSEEKQRCHINLNYFQSLQGFEDNLKGPGSNK